MNYYNDNDPRCCAWLQELIADGLIPEGEVSSKDVQDIEPGGLDGYTQVHLFAGIGGWPLALGLAGWHKDRPVWTGSCPCQPFSVAGKGGGLDDERHLWPAFRWLVAQRRPPVVFGEQVASKAGRAWLGGVRADLEAMGYAVGAADLCAASVGAPHIRARLWWVAHAESERRCRWAATRTERSEKSGRPSQSGGMAKSNKRGHGERCEGLEQGEGKGEKIAIQAPGSSAPGWSDSIWHLCQDGSERRIPIEPALFPLAHGLPGRVGLLRGAGNAIVPQVAAAFIDAYQEISDGE